MREGDRIKQKPTVPMKLLGHFASWRERLSIQVRLDFKFSVIYGDSFHSMGGFEKNCLFKKNITGSQYTIWPK